MNRNKTEKAINYRAYLTMMCVYTQDAITLGYPTVGTLIWASTDFFYNVVYYGIMSTLLPAIERKFGLVH